MENIKIITTKNYLPNTARRATFVNAISKKVQDSDEYDMFDGESIKSNILNSGDPFIIEVVNGFLAHVEPNDDFAAKLGGAIRSVYYLHASILFLNMIGEREQGLDASLQIQLHASQLRLSLDDAKKSVDTIFSEMLEAPEEI